MNKFLSKALLLSGIFVGSYTHASDTQTLLREEAVHASKASFTYAFKKVVKTSNYSWQFAFSSTGKTLNGWDHTAYIADIQTETILHQIALPSKYTTGVFSPDGSLVLIGLEDHTARLFDVATGTEIHSFAGTGAIRLVGFSPDGSSVIVGEWGKEIHVWDLATHQKTHTFTHETGFQSIAIGRNTETNEDILVTGLKKRKCIVWNLATGQELANYTASHQFYTNKEVIFVALSPDGENVAVIQNDEKNVHLWNRATGKMFLTLKGKHIADVKCAAFSPDGETILTGSDDHTARLWSVETGEELAVFEPTKHGYHGLVYEVQFTSNGDVLTGLSDGAAILWERQN